MHNLIYSIPRYALICKWIIGSNNQRDKKHKLGLQLSVSTHGTCVRCARLPNIVCRGVESPYFGAIVIASAAIRSAGVLRASTFPFFPALKQCGQRISSNPADGGGTKPDRWGDEPPGHAATTRHGEAIKTIVSPWTNTPSEAIVVVDSSSPYLSAAVNPSAPLPLQVNHHSNLA